METKCNWRENMLLKNTQILLSYKKKNMFEVVKKNTIKNIEEKSKI